MPIFKYVAKNEKGENVTASFEAVDERAARNVLHQRSLIILSIEEIVQKHRRFSHKKGKIKHDDLVIFARQLATMVDAGIALVSALDILAEQMESAAFKDVILKVKKEVEAGASFYDALAKHGTVFSPLFVNMVKAGESSGMLDEILERLADYMEKSNNLRRKIKSALVYPAAISIMAVIVSLVLILKVVPVFKDIFSSFGAALPAPTRILITFSDILKKFFPFLAIIFILSLYLFKRYINTEAGRFKCDRLLLRLPIFGKIFQQVAISKFTRTFSTLVKSGVPILASLDIVAKTAGNKIIENAVLEVKNSIKEGENMAGPLQKSRVFPPLVVRMISVGEQTGELEKMLIKISDFYDSQVDASVSALTSLIEPLIICFLGIVIGGIVICMFMPIFKLSTIINI